jgi:pyridinium-3,5-bisthiocarboxylic acid mononucleotide nickel chelatase
MKTIYFECFSGASGDMLLGALVDLGVETAVLQRELGRIDLGELALNETSVDRSGIAAKKVDVVVSGLVEREHGRVATADGGVHDDHGHTHEGGDEAHGSGRHLGEILALIAASGLSEQVKARASRVFSRLGEAEAKIHGTTPEEIHFHEVGAADAIADVVGTCIGLELLGVERIVCSAINVGSGTVTFSHGTYPVPAPATLELLTGVPVYSGEVRKELVTPTGAAILSTIADSFGSMPAMRVERVGYGAGFRDEPSHPNVLRAVVGECESTDPATPMADRVIVIEAAIDDMPAEALGFFVERALAEGALDVYYTSIQMKKNRPGVALTLLAEPRDIERMLRLVFRETTTIGVRHRWVARCVLEREIMTVDTSVGQIRIKVARFEGEIVNAAPEYEDCREAALRSGAALREVQALAISAFRAAEGLL